MYILTLSTYLICSGREVCSWRRLSSCASILHEPGKAFLVTLWLKKYVSTRRGIMYMCIVLWYVYMYVHTCMCTYMYCIPYQKRLRLQWNLSIAEIIGTIWSVLFKEARVLISEGPLIKRFHCTYMYNVHKICCSKNMWLYNKYVHVHVRLVWPCQLDPLPLSYSLCWDLWSRAGV